MKCRNCQAEIADKAIVCYRCGTATADLPEVPRKAPPPSPARSPWIVTALLLAIVIIAALLTPQTAPDSLARYGLWAGTAAAIAFALLLGRRR